MTGEDIIEKLYSKKLRQEIVDLAKSFTRHKPTQATLLCIAWEQISQMPPGYTDRAYIGAAYGIMRHKYEIYYMPIPKGRPSHDTGIRRAGRKLKKLTNNGS